MVLSSFQSLFTTFCFCYNNWLFSRTFWLFDGYWIYQFFAEKSSKIELKIILTHDMDWSLITNKVRDFLWYDKVAPYRLYIQCFVIGLFLIVIWLVQEQKCFNCMSWVSDMVIFQVFKVTIGSISKTFTGSENSEHCPIRSVNSLIWISKFWLGVLSQLEFTDLYGSYNSK